MGQKEETKGKNNIVFFDIVNGEMKDLYMPVTLSFEKLHETAIEDILPKQIDAACKNSGFTGVPVNLRFFDLKEKKKMTITDITRFPSGEVSNATDEEIQECEEKLSKSSQL